MTEKTKEEIIEDKFEEYFYNKSYSHAKATPRLKLISKNDFDEVKNKFVFFNQEKETSLSPIIAGANPSDVLALTVVQGSGLKILNVEILNEGKEEVFARLLKEGVGEIEF